MAYSYCDYIRRTILQKEGKLQSEVSGEKQVTHPLSDEKQVTRLHSRPTRNFIPEFCRSLRKQIILGFLLAILRCRRLVRSTPDREVWVRAPGWGHCVVFLGKTLYPHSASLHPGL